MERNDNIFEITGVVLAGGESSRMGEDKSLMFFKEQQLIDYSLSALEPFCKEILISSSKDVHKLFNYKIISDEFNNIGPIAGLYSALKNSKTNYIIVLPCDSPMVKKEFVKYLISEISGNKDALIPTLNHFSEPLFAIYHKRILPIVEKQIEKQDYKLQNLLEKISIKTIEVQDRSCFVNINTKDDYHKYLHYD